MRLSTKGSRANLSNGIDRRSAAQRRLSLSPGSSSGHTNSNFWFRRGRFVWVRFLQLREQIRPGTTGLWQVTVRRDNDLVLQQSLILAIWRSVPGSSGRTSRACARASVRRARGSLFVAAFRRRLSSTSRRRRPSDRGSYSRFRYATSGARSPGRICRSNATPFVEATGGNTPGGCCARTKLKNAM